MVRIAPSLMCANYLNLERDIIEMERAKVDLFHIDIMDGHFVKNLSMNLDMVYQLKSITHTPMDIHLMVSDPESYIPKLEELGIENACFHIEATNNPIRLVRELKKKGIKAAGIALNPVTGLDTLSYLIEEVDFIHLMTVEPGFAGQSFIPSMYQKIEKLDRMRKDLGLQFLIEIDGGVDPKIGGKCIEKGADILVIGPLCIFNKNGNLYDDCTKLNDSWNG
jgi:ribulose-phosphate 3-epimerase